MKHEYISASLKRSFYGPTLSKADDYTMKEVNSMLTKILGKPGVSAGDAQRKLSASSSSGSMAGESASMYGSGQVSSNIGSSTATGAATGSVAGAAVGLGLGVIDTLINLYSADLSYKRQNEFYDNHLSMPAKVAEYEEAGLNPMGLSGAGVGATSAPSVQPASPSSLGGVTDILSSLLGYKAQMARIEVDKERVAAQKEDIASRIEYRAEQKIYQQKLNDWFNTNQLVSLSKMQAETKLALEKVNTEQTQQQLNEAGVTAQEANAALNFQLALQKEWENSSSYRNVELGLMRAHQNLYNADAAESWQNVQNLIAVRENVIQDTALKLAQTEQGKQMLINLGLSAEQIKFAVEHQKGDLIFSRINQVTSSLKDVGIAAASVAATATGVAPLLAGPAPKIGF